MKVVIIGAGAAGLTAAICAAKNGDKVTVIEHEKKSAKKIAITGNGKCNLTNSSMSETHYYGDKKFVNIVLEQWGYRDSLKFFEEMGIFCYEKNGYYYPMSNQAVTICNALRDCALHLGVSIKTNNFVKKIAYHSGRFTVDVGIDIQCDKLILATGGMSVPKTGSDGSGYILAKQFGHHIVKPLPALTGLVCEDTYLKKASGVRVRAKILIENQDISDMGELQITDYGISGIPVFNISRMTQKGTSVCIDFLPEYTYELLQEKLRFLIQRNKTNMIATALNGMFHEKLVVSFLSKLNINPNTKCCETSEKDIRLIVDLVKNYKVFVIKRKGFDFSQVTQGGVSTDEIDPYTMKSVFCENLYFAGEIIDIDAECGGYNLQFAWSTGMIAGGYKRK